MIDWDQPDAEAIDGFTVGQIRDFVFDSVVTARCTECGAEHHVEPDARAYSCFVCRNEGCVTSPLIKLGLI